MNSGIESLHKILKDENRRKTLLLLHENGSLSYVDLMKALRIANTGKMNYHLKVLGDLLTKNEDGQYVLSEKGRLASRLLLGFPEDNITAPFGMNLKMWQRFWIAAAALQIVTLSSVLVLYVLGYIDFVGAVRGVIAFATGIALAFIGYNAPHYKPEPGSAKEKLRMKLVYTLSGHG